MGESAAPIVVGIDGSTTDEATLAWALAEAESSRRDLRVVYAFLWPASLGAASLEGRPLISDPQDLASSRTIADQVVAHALDQLKSGQTSVSITGEAIEGSAVTVLRDESARASLLVLGSRQAGTLGSVLGSVSAAVAARAHCPTVVLRGPGGLAGERPAVVVGIDGHDLDAAQTLLAFGFDYASRHGAPLRAVLCWRRDPLVVTGWRMSSTPPERVEPWLGEALAGWRDRYPDVEVHHLAIREHATAGLVTESLSQELLVVGTRGRHAIAGTLLGSVSQGVLHHAFCPVAVVPTHESAPSSEPDSEG